uniref:Filamin-C n=1 Tax=Ascaris suum TaxID=6253 RepID=F1KPG9_ASCSU
MQGAGRCLVTFIPQYPGKYVIDVTFNGEQVQGCPIRVDILPKQVGQSITTPIVSHQTATITSTAYKSDSLTRSGEPSAHSPTSPTLIRHLRQRSSDQLTPEHPRSPILVRKAESKVDSKTVLSSRLESSAQQSLSSRPWTSSLTRLATQSPTIASDRERPTGSLERPKKTEGYDASTREEDMSSLSEKEGGRLGYTVAQYGGEPPQTVSSRTYTDDGKGTVTSTFTSETRYSAVSPARTFEYSKGTLSGVADEGRTAMPTTYSETRVHESPKPSQVTPSDSAADARPSFDAAASRDHADSKVVSKKPQVVEYSSSSFVTDSRSYGIERSRSAPRDVPITTETLTTTDKAATPLRYFGDESTDEKESGGSDVAMITTTYERYRSVSREKATDGAHIDSTPYTLSTFDPAKIRATSRSADLKDSVYTAASYGTTDYRETKSLDDRYDRFPPPPPPPPPPINEPPIIVLGRAEELPAEPKNWNDYAAQERREHEKRAEAEAYRRECERRSQEEGVEEEEARRQAEKRAEEDVFRREEVRAKDERSRLEGGREYEKQVERDAYFRGEGWKAPGEGRDAGKLAEEDAYRGGRGEPRTDWTRSSREDEREREKYAEKEAYRRERGRERDFERSAEEQAYGPEGGVGWDYENPAEADARRRDQLMRAVKSEGYRVEHNEPPFLRTQSEFDAQKSSGRAADLRGYYAPEAKVIGEIPVDTLVRDREIEPTSLFGASQRIAEYMRIKEENGKIFERHGRVEPSKSAITKPPSKSSIEVEEPEGNIPTNVIEELTPRTRRKVDAQTLRREEDLDETLETMKEDMPTMQTLDRDEQLAHSQPPTPSVTPKSTPKTTPKLGLKFGKETKEQKLFDFGKSKFTSKHEVVRRGKDVDVKLESLKLSKDDQLRIIVIPPAKANGDRAEIEPKVKKSRHTYEISFKPTEVGTHKVMAYVNGVTHPLCPFPIRVYDASEIIVGEIAPQSTINDTVEFTVDAGRAGFGNLEMAIKDSNDTIIPSHVAQLESGTAKFLVTFNPTSLGMHTVNITFNKEVLKNSPFEVNIVEAKTTSETTAIEGKKKDTKKEKEEKKREEKEKLRKEKEEKQMAETLKRSKAKDSKKKKQVEKTTSVTKIPSLSRVGKRAQIFVSVAGDELLDVSVLDPLKNTVDSEIMEHEPGVKRVEFTPTVVGDHEIDIKYGGADVQGSPFTCRAYDPAKIVVANIPNGAVDKAVHFIVDASEAGVGNLEVAVNEGRIPSMAQSLGQHRYDISFVPREQVDHTISVRFNNEPVPGSPFVCRLMSPRSITASGSGLERIPVGQIAEFYVTVEGDKGTTPKVRIVDSQGDELLVKVTPSEGDPDQFIVQYTPKCVGNHQVEIEYDGEPITGSPFISKAFDATCARLTRVDDAQVGRPCTFTIDAARAGAGNMEIIVSVENRNVPNFVQAEGQARFKVSFTPQEAKEHIISVRFNGQPIPGSPMSCPVAAKPSQPVAAIPSHVPSSVEQQVRLVGDLSTGQVGQVKGFSIDTAGRSADCNVLVTDSKGNNLDVQLEKVLNGYHIQFVPLIPGEHDIEVELDGRPLGVGPFVMNVSAAPKITRIPSIVIAGRKLAFELDTGRRTGESDVRIEVRDEDGRSIPVHTEDDGQGVVRASCRVRDIGRHSVELFVDGKPCGERRYVDAIDASSGAVLINEIERARVGEPIRIALRVENGLGKHLAVSMSDPDRNQVPVSLQSVSNDVFEVEFIPNNEGDHQLSVKIADTHVRGSPFKVTVLDLSAVRVIGLKNDRVGVEQRFNVDWSNSGGVEATVRVTRDGLELPCTIRKVKPGLHVCSFTPKRAGLHLIDVMIDDVLLPECPYECIVNDVGSVRARGDALTRAQRGKTARFEVSMWNAGRGELDVLISDSRGTPLPVRCYKQQDDSYWVEFTPEHIGGHKIDITFADIPVAGSPFRCEVVDPKKVFIKGISEPLTVRQAANLIVDRESAGNGELTIEVADPTGQMLPLDIVKSPSGEDQISFLPVKLGQYKINAKLSGFQVQGMPQIFLVEEQAKPMLYGNAIERAVEIDEPTSVVFDAKQLKGNLKVDVRGPKKIKVRHTANKRADGTTEIVFTPNEVGRYTIDVEFNNRAIGGSPFDVEVLDPHKVVVNDEAADDNGVIHLAVQQRNIIDVDATAAGSGKLRAEVRDWDGKLVAGSEVESLGYGKYRVMFNPPAPGKYNIYLYWSEIAVQSAYPLHAIADAQQPSTSRSVPIATKTGERSLDEEEMSDHLRVVLRGEGLTRAACKEQSEFIVDGSDASREGRVSCSLIGQKADVPVRLTHLGNNVYKAVYTPLISGTYELQVMWDGRHVRGSPFRVQVESHASAAELIHVDTNTLKIGIINDDVKTLIDTRRAGPGQLSAQCMGPSKLAYCELYDHRDGTYTLSVRPSEVGKHTLVVKYSDEHVPGSPFVINVSHPPDASKVRVFGPGIEHGILSTFKSNFIVETKGAGAGQLTVRVRGPKGAFNVEMQREKKQERTIHCKYEPREPGDYQVEVKWHGEHVPGSPFLVMIVDTEQELQRFLRGDAPSPQPATPFIPPGWIGAPPPPLFLGAPPPGGPRPPFPPAHPALPPPPPHGPHGPLVPYGPPLPHTMRSGGRSRFANGY